MDCKVAERAVPVFLADGLDYGELKMFIEHIEKCPGCMEEVSIQYLVTEGMARLEGGGSFNLQRELNHKIKKMQKISHTGRKLSSALVMVELVAITVVIGLLWYVIL